MFRPSEFNGERGERFDPCGTPQGHELMSMLRLLKVYRIVAFNAYRVQVEFIYNSS